MKILLIIALSIFSMTFIGCKASSTDNEPAARTLYQLGPEPTGNQLSNFPLESISDLELADLKFMREEEKLARDNYTVSFQSWNMIIFNNIASSEQQHIDALLELYARYSIEDDAKDNAVGVFNDFDLQALYNYLDAISSNSEIDALLVGAEIEEIDIIDLVIREENSDNQDIDWVYSMLRKGSRNHLRAFVKNLDTLGVTYTPLHLSEEDYNAIINSPTE